MTDMKTRVDRLDTMIAEDRLIRGQWTDGHERACLLAALSPEAGSAGDAHACPAHVMPPWLAHMTPWIDDEVSAHAWPRIIRRYAALARRWGVLGDAAWERARVASLIAIVSEARSHCPVDEVRALAAIDAVLAWLRRGAPGSERAAAARASAAAEAAWEAASWAWAAASAAARAAASDSIATAVLDAIEAEIERSER